MAEFTSAPGAQPHPDSVSPRDSTAENPTSVARLNATIRDFIARWNTVWVEGEITAWNVRAGNVFARLKDSQSEALIGVRVWSSVRTRLGGDFAVGDHVVAAVKADYFVKSGDFSFTVSAMKRMGLGDQLERLEHLRLRLRQEGLFDPARKKRLPFLPQKIGLITGEKSDAEKDVLRNAELRWPAVSFRVEHVPVQGDRSVAETVAALQRLEEDPEVDVIIIARGGGDPQTLLGFSDERLLRAVAAAGTPVVSAIGHENDRPLLDDVADLRASTPTDAAKRAVPDVGEQRAGIASLRSRATSHLTQRVRHDITQLQQIRSRPVLRRPETMLDSRALDIVALTSRGRELAARRVDSAASHTRQLRASLRALSPHATLARGYAITYLDDGRILRDASDAPEGTSLTVAVERGAITAQSTGQIAEET